MELQRLCMWGYSEFPQIKPAKINPSLIGRLLIHVAVDVGGDLGGDMAAAQLSQRGLDGGG